MKIHSILFLFCSFALAGCIAPASPSIRHQEILALNSERQNTDYILCTGDKLAIKFFFSKELNDEVTIRPDGKISLQLIDEVQAAGLTAAELDVVLTAGYAKALKTSSDDYVLAVGDQISVKSYYYDKLNDLVVVRPDGKISLQLIDEIQAAGKKPLELDALLTQKYAAFLDNPDLSINVISFNRPDLSVIVKEFSSQNIYVGGEVNLPSMLAISGRLRMLDAIIQAKGALESGDLSRAILVRTGPENRPQVYTVNLETVLAGTTQDIWLKPYDIVYVPKTEIANIETFIRTHLWNLLPNQVGFSFLYNWNNEVQVKE